jgi:hypothetical protein
VQRYAVRVIQSALGKRGLSFLQIARASCRRWGKVWWLHGRGGLPKFIGLFGVACSLDNVGESVEEIDFLPRFHNGSTRQIILYEALTLSATLATGQILRIRDHHLALLRTATAFEQYLAIDFVGLIQ